MPPPDLRRASHVLNGATVAKFRRRQLLNSMFAQLDPQNGIFRLLAIPLVVGALVLALLLRLR